MSLSDALRGRDGDKIGDEFKRIHGSEYNVNINEKVNDELVKLLKIRENRRRIYSMDNSDEINGEDNFKLNIMISNEYFLNKIYIVFSKEDIEEIINSLKKVKDNNEEDLSIYDNADKKIEEFERILKEEMVSNDSKRVYGELTEDFIGPLMSFKLYKLKLIKDKYFENVDWPSKPISHKTIKEALDIMAEWYVNNVYTYQGKKQYDDFELANFDPGINNLNMYTIGAGGELTIEFLKDGKGDITIIGGNFNFINEENGADASIKKKGDNKTYHFQRMTNDLTNFKYDWLCYIKASKNACNNNHPYIKKVGSKLNYYTNCDKVSDYEYNDVGDDCVRFAFAVLELGTGEEAKNLGNLGKDAAQFLNDDDTKTKMLTYFDIYTGDSFIEEYNKGLNDGDMLVAKTGDGENENSKNTRNHCEFIYNNTLKPIGVFGWGNVKKTTNSRARFSIKTNSITNVKYIFNSEDGTYYSALYRKKVQ